MHSVIDSSKKRKHERASREEPTGFLTKKRGALFLGDFTAKGAMSTFRQGPLAVADGSKRFDTSRIAASTLPAR